MADDKPFVVFYDCCVPKTPLKQAMPLLVPFAHHIFKSSTKKDYCLFSEIDEERRHNFPGKKCLFLTTDQRFKEEVKGHPALLEKAVSIFILAPPSISLLRSGEYARRVAEILQKAYAVWLVSSDNINK